MIFLSNELVSTENIIQNAEYFSSPETFFANFSEAWKNVKSQVLKLETKDEYDEGDDPSYKLLKQGKFQEAISYFKTDELINVELYKSLSERKIDFVRCRPVKFPISEYVKYEFKAYELNNKHGEKIYCVEYDTLREVFEKLALHDFMVFDSSIAFIHDYDANGKIQGGWISHNKVAIENLIALFSYIRSYCIDFRVFAEKYNKDFKA